MPGRTRRVRLLAVLLCIVTVFFLYERNASPPESHTEYLSKDAIGGGSVLRTSDDKEQEPLAAWAPAPTQDLGPKPVQKTGLPSIAEGFDSESPAAASTSFSSAPASLGKDKAATLAPTTTQPMLPGPYASDERYTDDSDDDYGYTSMAKTRQHWMKLPEKFPVTSFIQLPTNPPAHIPRIQKQGNAVADTERLALIRDACRHAWRGFRQEAWGFDEVRPVTGGGQNTFNGWGATLVDSLDTLWIMGFHDEFEEAVQKASEIDFTTSSSDDIPVFEVTIRYLGGLLGAYDVSGGKHAVLLKKAVELAEILYSAFDTPNRMPETHYNWKPAFAQNKHLASARTVMAEIGTLSLEFTRLAQLTGQTKYYDAISRITGEFEKWQNNTRLPGMWPTDLNASGCKKPTRQARTAPPNQIPVFGSDGYMIASEPVKAVADHSAKKYTGSSALFENVADPDMQSWIEAKAKSEFAHSTGDDLLNGVDKSILGSEKDTKEGTANMPPPLRPAPSPRLKNPIFGERPSDSVLPDFSPERASPIQKRKLDPPVTLSAYEMPANPLKAGKEEAEEECRPQGFVSCSNFTSDTFTLGGRSDSTFEYLPKQYLLLGGRVDQYKTMYLESTKPAIESLLFRPMTADNRDVLLSGQMRVSINHTSGEFVYDYRSSMEHLTCFAGGMFAMGGRLFDMPEHIEIGRKLTDGCVWAYNSTSSGIMPEDGLILACEDNEDCTWNATRWYQSLDPIGAEFRAEQLKNWQVTYGVKDVEAWHRAQAAEEGVEYETSSVSYLPTYDNPTHISKHNNYPQLTKRQSLDSDFDPVDFRSAHVDDGEYSGYADSAPSASTSPPPIYTPAPPPTHEQYVMRRIADERIPPGFIHINSRSYNLRPEAIESVFYMYRITHEQYWRDMGWKMFLAIELQTRTPYGHSSLSDVTVRNPTPNDKMESFWIAETLKYFYLLFDDSETWSLDDWVLNTEAHLFKRPKDEVEVEVEGDGWI